MKTTFRILALTVCVLVTASVSVAQWISCLNTMPNSGISSLAYDGTNLYAGRVGRIHVSANLGLTWTERDIGANANVFKIVASGGKILAGTYGAGILVSTNSGATWTKSNGAIPTPVWIRTLTVVGTRVFAAATDLQGQGMGLYVTTDNGSSWTSVTSGIQSTAKIFSLYSSGTDVFAGGANGYVYYSSNSGADWTWLGTIPSNQSIDGFAACGSCVFAAASSAGVFCSTDKGVTWNPVNTGLTNWNFFGFLACGMNLFVGTNTGTFLSTNNGTSWSTANTGFTDKSSGPFVTTATHIFSGSETGVWKRPLSDFAPATGILNEVPYEFKLEQNYPNPFNPSTAIGFQLSAVSSAKLTVYDVLGREVATLVNEILNPGNYTVRLDGAGLPSGVYSYQLKAGTFTQTRRMILSK